ncbi:MAG: hypothetical protein M1814_005290 [Vezdaea aestivalis]|nr:MAG: hypothetical protein M1814_005290 [Vezdaea aestivalis]
MAQVISTAGVVTRDASSLLDKSTLMALEPAIAEPNPPFVFPARPTLSSDAPVDTSNVRGSVAQRRKANVLPSFDFHSSNSAELLSPLTPTSASPSLAIPSGRMGGHRRGGSEFIGGNGKTDGPGLMSTSPTKGHGILPVPRAGPPPGRRGHAHRRSGAISCHDLSNIFQPRTPTGTARGGSAPTSPSGPRREPLPTWDMTQEQQGANPSPSGSPESENRETPTERPQTGSRPRVGFSDTLEFIPRPLSSLSSETSSSVTTIRGHSASGSISSIASLTSPSPPARHLRLPSQSILEEQPESARPRTAEAMVGHRERAYVRIDGRTPSLKRPSSASALQSNPKPLVDSQQPLIKKISLPDCNSSQTEDSILPRFAADNSSNGTITRSGSPNTTKQGRASRVRKSPGRTPDMGPSKKQKNVKTWAGSILSRKTKPKQKSKSQKPRAQATTYPNPDMNANFANFDSESASSHHETSHYPTASPALPALDTGFVYQALSPQEFGQRTESFSPVIDLDAALGPFNTPNLSNSPSPGFGSSGFSNRRKMHSSGTTGGFSGPGMHYHRRTESAPEMVAFEAARSGLHRFGSNPTMADVFEEDEEEDDDSEEEADRTSISDSKTEGLGIGITVVESDSGSVGGQMDWSLHQSSPRRSRPNSQVFTDNSTSRSMSPPISTRGQARLNSAEYSVEILDEEHAATLRPSSIAKSSDSTVTPPLSAEDTKSKPNLPETTLAAPHRSYLTPQTPTSTTSSSFPSPDFPASSFDPPRVITASSSFTDDPTFSSLLLGEPGPELRMSVEDVPSLTSSNSTMTSAIREPTGQLHRGSGVYGDGETRSATNFATPRPRRATHHGKRASLVSLSRLVGSSHGERSKLSIESRAQPDSPEKRKDRKPKRLSRMVDFFKSKKTQA